MTDTPWDVLHIITRLELGGAQLATLYQIAHTRFATGRRYLAYGPGGLLTDEARRLANVECFTLPGLTRDASFRHDPLALAEVVGLTRRLKTKGRRLLVHTHSSKAGIVGRLGARLGGADCIVHSVHGFGHAHHGAGLLRTVYLTAERLAARCTDGFTADSFANIAQGERERLLAGRPIRVVRCGIDIEAFSAPARARARLRAEMDIAESDAVILNVSCLKPQKDPLAYVEVAARVIAERPNTTFLLAGDGDMRERVEQAAHGHNLGRRFRLLGWRRDIPDLLHMSDMLVLTSRWEGLPQVLPQAMAARLPIVATAVDGTPEAVVQGDNGLLFEPQAVSDIATAVISLIDDPEKRRRMGERGALRASEFSAPRMVQDLDAFYSELTAPVLAT